MTDPAAQEGSDKPVASPNTIAALVEAIDARARQAGSEGANSMLQGIFTSFSEVLEGIQDRLDALEGQLADRGDPAAALAEQVQASLATFNARLGRLEEAFVKAVEDSGSGSDAVIDQLRQTVLTALQEAPERPRVPEESAGHEAIVSRLESLEQQLASGLTFVAEQTEQSRRLLEVLEDRTAAHLADVSSSLGALSEEVRRQDVVVPAPFPTSELLGQVADTVRREAELLTQRVAALAVGIEASRAMLEQHVQDTENSLGRKASEVTRRLASDFGLRGRRSDRSGGRRGDPRQLGPGS